MTSKRAKALWWIYCESAAAPPLQAKSAKTLDRSRSECARKWFSLQPKGFRTKRSCPRLLFFLNHLNVDGDRTPVEAHAKRSLFLLDLFCGTAGVAAAFKAIGGDALGIDHMVDKRRVKGPVAKVDLAHHDGQSTVLCWIQDGKVDAVMLAPPCGTSSRAREIPLPRKGMQPVPLRSDRWPNGLPHLQGVAKLKVITANKLYKFSMKVIKLCVQRGIPVICENPKRSLMWLTEPFSERPEQKEHSFSHECCS